MQQDMTVIWRKLDELHLHPANERKHPEKNLDALKGSLVEFGFQKPVVINEKGLVLAGNGTVMAARALGWERVPCVVSSLDDLRQAGFRIADNRTAELAEWDLDALAETTGELDKLGFDLGAIGFDEDFLASLNPEQIESKEGLTDDDAVPEQVETRCKPGDLWILGNHRLLCGDSTNALHAERLMGGARAEMVFTDPPYGVAYQSNMRTKSQRFEVIENDDTFLTEWVGVLPIVSHGWVFVWTTWKVIARWIEITAPIGELTNVIVWDKGGGGIGDLTGTFSTDYEVALVFNRGAKILGKRLGSVWSIGKDRPGDYLHPTQKPVELAETAITNCTSRKDAVLDLFGGSGSTLIACEKTDRRAFLMELDPRYCDVILTRWEQFTGQTAVLSSEQ